MRKVMSIAAGLLLATSVFAADTVPTVSADKQTTEAPALNTQDAQQLFGQEVAAQTLSVNEMQQTVGGPYWCTTSGGITRCYKY